jgi:phosphatidate cytidylyltransferase
MNNLVLRAVTGTLFVVVLVGSMVFHPLSFTLLFALITGLTIWEFSTNVNRHAGAAVNRLINTTGGVYLFLAFFYFFSGFGKNYSDAAVFAPYLVTLLVLPIAELYLQHKDPLKSWAYAFASQLYVALPFSLLHALAFHYDAMSGEMQYKWILPLSIFIFLWTSDTGAYCVGSLLHKKFPAKLFERISPNKSWIGSIGGGIFCLIAAAVLHHFFQHDIYLSLGGWLGLGLVVCVFGTWGDLVESLFKRQLGIKDSGNLLPGHGGMLDRFDSALLAIPAAVLYLYSVPFVL